VCVCVCVCVHGCVRACASLSVGIIETGESLKPALRRCVCMSIFVYVCRCDTAQTRTAAARCRGAIQQDIFTAYRCCVSRSQHQGLVAPVLCHRHHLPAGGPYMIRMKTSQKQAKKTCRVNILYTQCIRRVLRSSFLYRTACTPPFVVSFQ